MQFGSVPVLNARGGILAHSLRANQKVLKKGRILTDHDVEMLLNAGFKTVIIAQLSAGDVAEDEAAARVAAAFVRTNARQGAPFTGRANLYAELPGIARVDAIAVDAANM